MPTSAIAILLLLFVRFPFLRFGLLIFQVKFQTNSMSTTKNNKVIRKLQNKQKSHDTAIKSLVLLPIASLFFCIVVALIKNNFFTFLFLSVSLSNYFWNEYFSSNSFSFRLSRANIYETERPNGSEHQFYITKNHVEMDMARRQM